MGVSKSQPMREAEIAAIDALNSIEARFPVTSDDIATGAITEKKLASSSVYTDALKEMCVTNTRVANYTLSGTKLQNKTITAQQIADGTITATQLAANAVNANVIADGAITAEKLADGVIPSSSAQFDVYTYQVGSISITANGSKSVAINFPTAYTSTPTVYFCSVSGISSAVYINSICSSMSKSAVSVTLVNLSSNAIQIPLNGLHVFVLKE